MSRRSYNGGAAATTLASGISSGATSVSVADASTWPSSGAFSVVVDRGLAGEEKMLVSSRSGNTLTIGTRGYDGTTGTAHNSGATMECCGTAIDFDEANAHVNASAAVHGLAGTVVGTTDSQTLTNKTVNLASNTLTGTTAQFNTALSDNDFATLAGSETLTNKTLTTPAINGSGGALTLPAGPDTLVGRATTDTITNKTVNLANNTVTGTTAQFNTALSDNDFATLAGSETLTNKTLTSPALTSPSSTNPEVHGTISSKITFTSSSGGATSDAVLQVVGGSALTNKGAADLATGSFTLNSSPVVSALAGDARIQSGRCTVTFSASSSGTGTVTFSPAFTNTPVIIASIEGGSGATGGTIIAQATSTTNANIACKATASLSTTWTVDWIAIGS